MTAVRCSFNKELQLLAWDGRNPSSLQLPHVIDGRFVLSRTSAESGVGCNEYELSALVKIISSHEDYMKLKQNAVRTNSKTDWSSVASLLEQLASKYRAAIRDCLSDWHTSLREKFSSSNTSPEDLDEDYESSNLQLLQVTYNIMHISDIFLSLLPSPSSWDYHIDPYQKPGIATASTVRYLRHHHLDAAEEMVANSNPAEIDEMMNSAQPDQFKKGRVYWEYIKVLIIRGCLEKAWHVLSKHSLFVVASAIQNPDEFSQMTEIYRDFSHLKEILLRAPLPGGRNDNYDDALPSESLADDYIDEANLFSDDLDILPLDYLYWDTQYLENGSGSMNATTGDQAEFDEMTAFQKHRSWSEYVKDIKPFFNLTRRIPQIDSVLAMLLGDFTGIKFSSWAEQLCAELLFRCPNSRPIEIANNARRLVKFYFADDVPYEVATMLNIMEGDAASAIALVYGTGGSAGAAVPATIMSLLYNLFIDSGILPNDLATRQTEFLCEASSSIISSLAETNPDIGSQLAIRLLVPYSIQQRNVEIVATISNILDHYHPSNGDFATAIISYASPLLDLKSVQVLEGCVSVILCAYRSYRAKLYITQGITLLLKGIELESRVLAYAELGLCYKTLVAECQNCSLAILMSIAGYRSLDNSEIIATGISKCFANEAFDFTRIPQASLLLNVIKVLECYHQADRKQDLGDSIIACLNQHVNSAGVQRFNAPVCAQWYLLRIACQLLDSRGGHFGSMNPVGSPFEKKAISLMMERLLDLAYYKSLDNADFKEMEETLTQGFSRAIISESTSKMSRQVLTKSKTVRIDSIHSVDIDLYDTSIQERVVKAMLD